LLEILLILFTLLFLLASAEEIPNYSNPYAPIFTNQDVYTWTDKIEITIIAPSWNTNRHVIDSIGNEEGHFIKISNSKDSLEPYKLTETEPNSGVFTGEVILTGFLHDVDGDGKSDTNPRTTGNGPTNGFLEAERDGGITISFEFADGIVLTQSAIIRWNIGEVKFEKLAYAIGENSIIQVRDPDMNLNPEGIDQIEVQVLSDSDSAGILVNALETSEDSGLFEVSISFTKTQTSSGSRLFALPDDVLQAKYDDYTLPKPYSTLDNLEITSQSKFVSNIPAIDRISTAKNFIADSLGNEIGYLYTNEQLQIVGEVQNNQDYKQDFVFIVQVADSDGKISALSWLEGQLNSYQNLELAQSWTPTMPGEYTIETFVWNSFKDTIPLAPSMKQSFFVNN
jgi:hypothetical protein